VKRLANGRAVVILLLREFWGSGQEFGNTRYDPMFLHVILMIADLLC